MPAESLNSILHNPALSVGIALAFAIPMLALGLLFWVWGYKVMRPLVAFCAGCAGALVGCVLGSLLVSGWMGTLGGGVLGLGAGIGLSLGLYRFTTAALTGLIALVAVLSVGLRVMSPTSLANPVAANAPIQPLASNASPGAGLSQLLSIVPGMGNEGTNASSPERTLSQLASQSISSAAHASKIQDAAKPHGDAASQPAKEYVDVRTLRKGRNTLSIEHAQDAGGHKRIVIRDTDANASKAGQEFARTPSHASSTPGAKQAPVPGLSAETNPLLEQLRASGLPEQQLEQLSGLLGAGVGAGQASPLGAISVRGLLALLASGAGLASMLFGLAMWKHRQAEALVGAAMGSALFIGAISLVATSAAAEAGKFLAGMVATLLSGLLWLVLSLVGAFLQLRKQGILWNDQPAFDKLSPAQRLQQQRGEQARRKGGRPNSGKGQDAPSLDYSPLRALPAHLPPEPVTERASAAASPSSAGGTGTIAAAPNTDLRMPTIPAPALDAPALPSSATPPSTPSTPSTPLPPSTHAPHRRLDRHAA